ncbi:MAG TPA: hypothetical protein VNO82_22960 [Solirubrobacteraceae bacterium]|nr:hypothetical protein [Solirubrobacteraceae bacterium]
MASTKQSGARKRPSSSTAKSAPARKSGSATRSSGGSRNGVARAKPAKKRATAKRAPSTRAKSTASSNNTRGGVPDTIKQVANTAKRPAVAVGAAAAGLAGGLVLRSRTRRKTVLGMTVPRSVGKTLSGLDAKSVAKTVGQASKQFAKTTKNVSKDLERAGDQAERIGKILD